MMFKTHLAFGFLVSLIVMRLLNINEILLFLFVALFFSIFPDIDNNDSKIGRRHKIISRIFRHRGILHTVFPILVLVMIAWYLNFNIIAIAIITGYGSHLFIDGFTKAGINFLYPVSKLRISGFILTGSFVELILFLILLGIDLLYLGYILF